MNRIQTDLYRRLAQDAVLESEFELEFEDTDLDLDLDPSELLDAHIRERKPRLKIGPYRRKNVVPDAREE